MQNQVIAQYHTGGQMFSDEDIYYPEGWYVFDGSQCRPLVFSTDGDTKSRLVADYYDED